MTLTTTYFSNNLLDPRMMITLIKEVLDGKHHSMDVEDWMYAYFVADAYCKHLSGPLAKYATSRCGNVDEMLNQMQELRQKLAKRLAQKEAEIWLHFSMLAGSAIEIGRCYDDPLVPAENKRYYAMFESVAQMFDQERGDTQFSDCLKI